MLLDPEDAYRELEDDHARRTALANVRFAQLVLAGAEAPASRETWIADEVGDLSSYGEFLAGLEDAHRWNEADRMLAELKEARA